LAAGSNPLTVTVSNVNGTSDDIATDDAKTWTINPIVPATGKVVVAEEGTGTWCQYCPRGAVFMEIYAASYKGFIAPIAVHNGGTDPMLLAPYDAGMGFSSFPNSKVDRGTADDPSAIQPNIESQLLIAPTAFVKNGATWNSTTRELKVSVTYDFQKVANNNYKICVVLTEDSVSGTTSGYKQSNAYAGGANGPMGGFENLPNPVPASQMNYNFVARALAPSFAGTNSIFPSSIAIGDSYTGNFTFTLPSNWDESKIKIVGMLLAPTNKIDNAGIATIAEAVANGYVDGSSVTAVQELPQLDREVTMYPNPANDFTQILLNLNGQHQINLQLIDVSGKTMLSKNYGTIEGANALVLPTNTLNPGIYFVQLLIDGKPNNLKLIKE
jgi:hypothetical protein